MMGLGCWAIGGPWRWLDGQGGWGDINDEESIRAIHCAIEHGINFFDTAANYGTATAEVLARTGWKAQSGCFATNLFQCKRAEKQVTFRQDDHLLYVRAECEASLRRLNTDVIDLYQLHVWDIRLRKRRRWSNC
jgi:aryl-alcohol dehydrogenase-like predicted oxidoreductase